MTLQKIIAILGNGTYQEPLIIKCKELGYKVIVFAPEENKNLNQFIDIFYKFDITNSEPILNLCKKNKIDSIITTGSDVGMPTIGLVNDELKLFGPSFKSASISSNKTLMKDQFYEFKVRTPSFKVFHDFQEAYTFAKNLNSTFMVKAPDSSGSRGITHVKKINKFKEAWLLAKNYAKSNEIIIEEFVEGEEFGAQIFVLNNKVEHVIVHGDITHKAENTVPIGHFLPYDLNEKLTNQLFEQSKRIIKALNLNNCIANADFILKNEQIYALEVGARMGATCIPENIGIFYDFNAYEYLIDLSLGKSPVLDQKNFQPNACKLITSPISGVLKSIKIPDKLLSNKDIVEIKIDIFPGDKVNKFVFGPDRIGHIVVKGKTVKEAKKLAFEVEECIDITLI